MRLLEILVSAIRNAGRDYDPKEMVPPVCILWPDKEKMWENVIPMLFNEMFELRVLGSYDPDKRTGPAIGLRCKIFDFKNETEFLFFPILYLPGVGTQDLVPSECCHELLIPLVELQYRGMCHGFRKIKTTGRLSHF